nr:acyltransferase [Defluviicoccus vanus]
MQNDRLAWVDCAKGIGITLVVYTHVQMGVLAAGLAPDDDIFAWVNYALFLTHMPLFFFLSGLFVGRSIEKGSKHFLLSKIQTVVYPYFLWSFVQGAIQITMAGSTNNVVHWGDLFVIAWKPFMQFWFLYALFLAQLAALLLYRHKPLLIALALLAYACRSIAPGILGDACYQLPFFVIGMLLADRGHWTGRLGSSGVRRGARPCWRRLLSPSPPAAVASVALTASPGSPCLPPWWQSLWCCGSPGPSTARWPRCCRCWAARR